MLKTYDEFLSETWDYVSSVAVSEEFWNNNIEMIKELTHEYYQYYKNSTYFDKFDTVVERITTKDCGKLMEISLSLVSKSGLKR